ncbi:CNVH-domain-containing protein [Hypoxylon rubiginosum]|uniref:CNVH-domain-containing protein n=1 Tax=Hypoxylon rubiginosum TaxID=110542 RepID=A0ACC0DB45_9PEZI|nr:CNVH-domain-containing protein [Hypoxylon rubiginosum]
MSFSQSSRNIRLSAKPGYRCELLATCLKADKTEQDSRLDLNRVLGNESGYLEVGASNFASSAVAISLEGTVLSVRLRAKDGAEHDDTINLDAIVENRDGELVFLDRKERVQRNIAVPIRAQQPKVASVSPQLGPPACNGCQDWPDPKRQDIYVFRKQLQNGKATCASCGLLLQVIKHYKPSHGQVQKASCTAEKPSSEQDLHRLHLEYYLGDGLVVKKECVLHRPLAKSNPLGVFVEVRARYLPGAFSSLGSVEQARTWLDTCIEKHEKCESSRRRPLPARVLDLGTKPTDSVRLLCTTGKAEDSYACLSHCWGKPKKGQPEAITLTTRNESSLTRGIAPSDLPKNYRDGIQFCRLLGIRYLWIDALCIIQDSKEDWACESLKMASYYGNCTICLAATRSPDHDGGFQPVNMRMEYQIPGLTGPGSRILITEKPPEVTHLWSAKKFPHEEHYPLLTRAWVYQERRLSPRILHFCGNELVFECKQHTACECDSVAVDSFKDRDSWTKAYETYYATHHDVTKVDDTTKIEHEWHSWVRAYSRLNLTYVSDRLPAISGVAQQVKERREAHNMPTGRYLAGLWEETLLNDMSWCVGLDRVRVRRDEETHHGASYKGTDTRYIRDVVKMKPDEYVAPSWSWASVLSPVEFAPFGYKTFLCQLLDVQTQTVGPNEFSRVTAGHVLLRGRLLETRWNETDGKMCLKDVLGTRLSLPLLGDRGMVWFPDYDIRSEGKHKLPKDERLYILPLVSRPILGRDKDADVRMRFYPGKTKVEAVYLVLKRIQSAAATPVYERVGWAEYTGSDWEKVRDMGKARDTNFLIV